MTSAQGRYVLEWEQRKYDQLVVDIFGFNAVQMGLARHDFLSANRMPYRYYCDDVLSADASVSICSDMHQLPFGSATIDLVVLPHVLEFAHSPHQILREVERILVPDGEHRTPIREISKARGLPPSRGKQ